MTSSFYLLACLDAPLACQFHVDMPASRFFFFSVIVNFATTNLKIKFPSTHESFNFRYVLLGSRYDTLCPEVPQRLVLGASWIYSVLFLSESDQRLFFQALLPIKDLSKLFAVLLLREQTLVILIAL